MSSADFTTSFGEVSLSVAPVEMYRAASEIEEKIKNSSQSFESMLKLIQDTSRYWEGDVSENERKRFENQNVNFQKLIKNLNNYVIELKTITAIYEKSEQGIKIYAESLQSGILS